MIHEKIRIQLTKILLEAKILSGDVARHKFNVEMWRKDNVNKCEDWIIEKDFELIPPFEAAIETLHWSTICYLDALNLNVFLQEYLNGIGKDFNASEKASDFDVWPDLYDEIYNRYLFDMGKFLAPLGIINQESAYLRVAGIQYLETILKNTAVITSELQQKPKSEKYVYQAVKQVLFAVFSSAKKPSANFLKIAQEYKPDILIPQLAAAIEYKYADSEQKLKTTIGQIADDVKGYSGDSDYKIFYAVFYVTQDFWGEDRFYEAWKEKEFPKNWKAFYVVGS